MKPTHSLFLAALALLAGCKSPATGEAAAEPTGLAPRGSVASLGGGSVAERMARDLLAEPSLGARTAPPRIIVAAEYFQAEGAATVNKALVADRLRVELNRAAQGRALFVGRGFVAGSAGDYRLNGRIVTSEAEDPRTGRSRRTVHISFELLDLEFGALVWSRDFDYATAALDDPLFR